MFYKFIYFQLYTWTKKHYGDEYPQFYAINIICLLLMSNIMMLWKILSSIEILGISMIFFDENTFIKVICILIVLYIFNSIYFFYINNWSKIIEEFEKKEIDFRLSILYKLYVLGTIMSFVVFLFI